MTPPRNRFADVFAAAPACPETPFESAAREDLVRRLVARALDEARDLNAWHRAEMAYTTALTGTPDGGVCERNERARKVVALLLECRALLTPDGTTEAREDGEHGDYFAQPGNSQQNAGAA